MKNGIVMKSAAPGEEELKLINSYSRRELTADEVYLFSVVLCDNDVDRDFERFTNESLESLKRLFVGKCGIFDHNPSARNQSARIISCKTETVAGQKNSLGENYVRLTARAYMPVTEGNRELRELIDSGIIREVSVGCSVSDTLCSICGGSARECGHTPGRKYGGRLCFGELVNPTDAYEWSFVAVPAQKNAGVIKAFNERRVNVQNILKSIENGEALKLGSDEAVKLKEYIKSLKKQAADGVLYRSMLVKDVMKLSAVVQPEISRATMENITGALSISELKELKAAFKKRFDREMPPRPQLFVERSASEDKSNNEFRI